MKRRCCLWCCLSMVSVWIGGQGLAGEPPAKNNVQVCQQAIDRLALARQGQREVQIAAVEKQVRRACFPVTQRAPVVQQPIAVGPEPKAVNPPKPLSVPPPGARSAPLPELAIPAAPSVLTTCDPGGCWDNHGNRYNGSGAILFGNGGQPCQRNGDRIECR